MPTSLLNILEFPDSRLLKKALRIDNVSGSTAHLADEMLRAMYAAPGIGLAATQVNVQQRLIVCDVSEEKNAPLIFINPKILEMDGETETQEGCLSVPGFYETVIRPEKILLEAVNREGEPFQMEAEGLLSVCIQHEIDHLDGKLFVDYLSSAKRQLIRKKLLKQQKLSR